MKILLIYPPPWKIAPDQCPQYSPGEGPPANFDPEALRCLDFLQAPYGLLCIAAHARAKGLDVSVCNLADAEWPTIEQRVQRWEADLFGFSCLTTNRRGTGMLAALVRKVHPQAHIVVGGPHVSALPVQTLAYWPAVDSVIIGEGEITFLDLVSRLKAGRGIAGLPGAAWRNGDRIEVGPPRARVRNLDQLTAPQTYFPMRTLITARGCPMACTFCSSRAMWGRQVRSHSVEAVLDMLEAMVCRDGCRFVAIKDATFTADRKRILALCKEICARKLPFFWGCDTRADCLDETVIKTMRRAGCVRISLGVESAATTIRRNIKKHLSLDQVLEATRTIKKFGIQVRYYLMVGNRGETMATFHETLAFIDQAKPNQYVFSQLHLYPGTEEFQIFEKHGIVSPEIFFERDFFCLTCFAGQRTDENRIRKMLYPIKGLQHCWSYPTGDRQRIQRRLPDDALAHIDLCRAYLRNGNAARAERHLDLALHYGYFLPDLAQNFRACVRALQGDLINAAQLLDQAAAHDPSAIVTENRRRLNQFIMREDAGKRHPLKLHIGDSFICDTQSASPEFPDSGVNRHRQGLPIDNY